MVLLDNIIDNFDVLWLKRINNDNATTILCCGLSSPHINYTGPRTMSRKVSDTMIMIG